MPKWGDMSAEDKRKVYDAIAAVYEEEGHPAGLGEPGCHGEYVNVLMAKQKQDQVRPLHISGDFAPDQQELVDRLKTKLGEATKDVDDVVLALKMKRGVGCAMGDIEDVSKLDGGETAVKHEAGQVILLDFWATWCPPCQAPMAHNQKMLEDNKDKWGGKVRLIGLSIDQTADKVKTHVEAKGWTAVEHYHVRNGKCVADKEFGVQGVPHVALVDTEGKIVFVGHPASRKLEEDINLLLEGGKITGAGTTAAGGDDEEGEEEFKDNVAAEKVDDLVKEFNELSEKHLQTEETKTAAEGMPRAFCVLVHE